MALTTYTGDTAIIATLGTTPEERALETDEFKAKFDEGLTALVAWFNATHIVEADAHIGDTTTAHGAVATATANKIALRDAKGQVVGLVPTARVYNDANQSIANNTLTALAFNSERFDNDTIHDNSTNNSRLTCKTAGKYLITGQAIFDFHATGGRAVRIRHNGTTDIAVNQVQPPTTSALTASMIITTIYDLAVNDYVELFVNQTSGGALNILTVSNMSPEFMMVKVG